MTLGSVFRKITKVAFIVSKAPSRQDLFSTTPGDPDESHQGQDTCLFLLGPRENDEEQVSPVGAMRGDCRLRGRENLLSMRHGMSYLGREGAAHFWRSSREGCLGLGGEA